MAPPTEENTHRSCWTFLTNHAEVLLYIASHPSTRVRDISHDVEITERNVYRILRELEDAGYITRKRRGDGNRVVITIDERLPLRRPHNREVTIHRLLNLLDNGGRAP